MRYRSKQPAIAMIELIFSIVIMGIVMLSAPMLISTASNTTAVALQQEAIHEATTRVNMILTYSWDENNTDYSCIPPVLHVADGDTELKEVNSTGRRIGVPNQTRSRTYICRGNEFNASTALKSEGGDRDDMDDFTGETSLVLQSGGSGGKDYLEKTTVKISTTVTYVNDNANYSNSTFSYVPTGSGTSTNIKKINVTLTSDSSASELNQKEISLTAFACNIGEAEYESRIIP